MFPPNNQTINHQKMKPFYDFLSSLRTDLNQLQKSLPLKPFSTNRGGGNGNTLPLFVCLLNTPFFFIIIIRQKIRKTRQARKTTLKKFRFPVTYQRQSTIVLFFPVLGFERFPDVVTDSFEERY